MKPTMFIGSSVEGLGIAEAIQSNLFHDVEITIWSQGVFELSTNTLDQLIAETKKYDFATFILSPDDITKMRKKDFLVVRDNVLFELGLFAGVLGKKRVFFVTPDMQDFHLPTDLLGTTPATYDPSSHQGNLNGCLGHACTQIKTAIKKTMHPSEGLANLGGEWNGYWEVLSNNFEQKNHFETTIKQIGNTIISSLVTEGISYRIEGEIHRNGIITGMWGNPENGATYFGSYQLIISPCGKKLEGKWSGFKSNNTIDAGNFHWTRK